MIKYTTQRYADGYACGGNITRAITVHRALYHLLEFELGFGGTVVASSEEQITIRTSFLGTTDVTQFSGTATDMCLIREAVGLFKDCDASLSSNARSHDPVVECVRKITGKGRIARAVVVAMMASTEQEADALVAASSNLGDLCAALVCMRTYNLTVTEAIQLLS